MDGLQRPWGSHSLGTHAIGHDTLITYLPRSLFMCQGPDHKFRETIGEVVERTSPRSPCKAKGTLVFRPHHGGPAGGESKYLVGGTILRHHVGSWRASGVLRIDVL